MSGGAGMPVPLQPSSGSVLRSHPAPNEPLPASVVACRSAESISSDMAASTTTPSPGRQAAPSSGGSPAGADPVDGAVDGAGAAAEDGPVGPSAATAAAARAPAVS